MAALLSPSASGVRRRRWTVALAAAVATVALGALAFVPLLLTLPEALGIEWFCLLDGPSTRAAEVFVGGFAVAFVLSGVGLIVFVALRTDRVRRWWWLLPPARIAALVAAEGVVRLVIGPQPCQGSGSWF